MKKIVITFCLFSSLIALAQIEPLLDHTWQLEKILIGEDETLALPDNQNNDSVWANINFTENEFSIVDIYAMITIDESTTSFTIEEINLTSILHSSVAYDLFSDVFIYCPPQSLNTYCNPFTFSFGEEEDRIYLYITNSNGDVATFFATTLSNTAFERIELSIYPNPTSNLLHIEASQTDISRVEIIDVQGKRVMQVNSVNLREVDVSQLTNGMYFLKVSTSDGELTRKFVKK